MNSAALIGIFVALGVVFVIVVAVVGGRAGRARGYSGMGGQTIVRCSRGHLSTTLWIVGSSLKAVRLARRLGQAEPGRARHPRW